jgi:hypothetical protein
MSQGLRWKLILGCLVLAAVEAPGAALVLVQDLEGPWRGETPARAAVLATVRPTPALKPHLPEASVVQEDVLGRARRDSFHTDPRPVAILLAR